MFVGRDEQIPVHAVTEDGSPTNISLEKHDETDAAPDGGVIAWAVVAGAWCCSFCSMGWINSIGIFQEYYQTHTLRQYSSSTIAWIPSLQLFFLMGTGPLIGHIYDRHGPRYLLLGGTFLHVFGLMMASISKEYYQILLSQGVCSALGAAAIYQPALSSVSGWFEKKKPAAYGALSTGSSIGGIVFPIMVTHLIDNVGYGWAMRISAFLILFLLAVANLTIRCRVPPEAHEITLEKFSRPLRDLIFTMVLVGFAFLTFGIFVPINYLVLASTALGMSASLAQYLVSIFNAASFFGRFGSGLIAVKLGNFNVFIVVCTISGILVLGLWLPGSSNSTSIAFAVLFGFFSGAYISLSPAMIAQISPPEELGYRLGLLFLAAAIPGLVTNPIAGAIVDSNNGGYTGMKIFAGVLCLAGVALTLVSRLSKTGPKIFVKV